jgi:NADPH:quinone reductase
VLGRQNQEALLRLVEDGAIDPYVCAGLPLARAVEAMKMLTERRVVGKVVVTMNGYSIPDPGGQ